MRFVISDPHFSHENIIHYCDRPYQSAKEMDSSLIKNWNSVVSSSEDIVYVLGDFTLKGPDFNPWFRKTLSTLRGTKILILGNHDKLNALSYVELGFQSVHTSLVVDNIFLAHDPSWANAIPKDMPMFCGHVHQLFVKLTNPRKILNVGVDVWNYTPVSWDKAVKELLSC